MSDSTRSSYQRIHIRKEALKFAAAHMTVFADGSKERLHGHNYRTEISIDLPPATLESMVPFSEIKLAMRLICEQWDEKVLLAERCPFLKSVTRDGASTGFELCGKRYVLPSDELEWLPVDNITTETLSARFGELLIERIDSVLHRAGAIRLELRIEEITGQGASWVTEWRSR